MGSDNFEREIPYFTDCGVETIEVLIGRNRYGRQVTESLIEYINMRVEMEKSIAKGFEKLASFEFPTLQPIMKKALKKHASKIGSGNDTDELYLGTALLGIQQDLADQAKAHKAFAKSLETDILAKFKKSFNEQVGTKMKHKTRLLEAAEDITKTTKRLETMNDNHEKFLRRANVDVDLSNPRAEAERDRAINTANQSGQKILDLETALATKKETFQRDITLAAADIIREDIKRIDSTAIIMSDFAKIIQDHDAESSRFADYMVRRLSLVSGKDEVAAFKDKYIMPFLKGPSQRSMDDQEPRHKPGRIAGSMSSKVLRGRDRDFELDL